MTKSSWKINYNHRGGIMSFNVLDNPVIKSLVSSVHDKNTEPEKYRNTLFSLGAFMAYEISDLLDKEKIKVQTNFGTVTGIRIQDENVIVVAILRAAIPMTNGVLSVFSHAQCGMVSARRLLIKEGDNTKMAQFNVPVEYCNVPQITKDSILILPDPALASGSSAVTVLNNIIKNIQPKRIIVLSVVCAKEGVDNILKYYPKAEIYSAHLGSGLNSHGYIVPDGPGDAGDRSFGLGSTIHKIK